MGEVKAELVGLQTVPSPSVEQGAEDVEGEHHNNPYAFLCFRGEEKKTKMVKKTRDPLWNEDFQFMLDEPPLQDKIRIEVMSKSRAIFRAKGNSFGLNLSKLRPDQAQVTFKAEDEAQNDAKTHYTQKAL
ncbi:unnamed protein product [Prunus armeniaca]|uniref:C2 domain-containing protein n=1 Tax=Prunus armeniaca TaxID=36596 RepID=A0A6J5U5X7_PRUAR|nr:unnamed protein product [Prunus armeniaca]CAB4300927.1 unnamed protein product [Prunus armeniaca]